MVGMARLLNNAPQCSALLWYLHAVIVHMITVQLQSKMYSWNEWLAWLCLFSNAHASSTCCTCSTQQIIVHDNCTATIKDVQLE
jgi:hypothetical protein